MAYYFIKRGGKNRRGEGDVRMLIVDDSSSARCFLKGVLDRHGSCDLAGDGREAVEMVDRSIRACDFYDLVLMDIMMPEMDGLSATRAIREMEDAAGLDESERSRIVIVSCLSDREHMIDAQYGCGADAYLTKPVDPGAMEEMLVNLDLAESPFDMRDEA